jgi:hypothetical protein
MRFMHPVLSLLKFLFKHPERFEHERVVLLNSDRSIMYCTISSHLPIKINKMKKIVLISLAFITYTGILAAQKPEKIYSFAKVSKPHEYYVQQAGLWWKEIEKDKSNESAWDNYYKANRYSLMTFKDINRFDGHRNDGWTKEAPYLKELDEIISLIGQNIPNTFTYYRLQKIGSPSDEAGFSSLQKAYEINPDNPEIYDRFVTYYEMKGNIAKRKEFNEKLYKANYISPGFLTYGFNVLMTMKPNGIILTFGDNDTFPLWLLQDVLSIRTDVTVLNVSLLSVPEYREIIFRRTGIPVFSKIYKDGATSEAEDEIVGYIIKNKPSSHPLYIGLPAWNQLEEYERNLYLVGLALEYSTDNIDNIASLKNNFENRYALDYVKNRFEYDISVEIVDRMNINYLPGIFKLYEHYTLSGDLTHAQRMKELGLLIAQKGGQEWLNKASLILK